MTESEEGAERLIAYLKSGSVPDIRNIDDGDLLLTFQDDEFLVHVEWV